MRLFNDAILKSGSQEVKRKDSIIRNIARASKAVALIFYRCLGPNGMNILVVDEKGDTFYAHDAYTVLEAVRNNFSHPVARLLHEAVKTLDREVGDGGKTFCILLGEAMRHAEALREEGVRQANIIAGYNEAISKSIEFLEEIAIRVDRSNVEKIVKVVYSRLPLSTEEINTLTHLTLEAIEHIASGSDSINGFNIDNIKIKNKLGGDITSSFLVKGVVIDKIWPGHIQMPQYISNPRIALLTAPIEIKRSTLKYEYTVYAKDVSQLKEVMDGIAGMYEKACEILYKVGATVVLSRKELSDLVLEGLAKRGIMVAYRFSDDEIEFISKATGARPVHNLEDIQPEDLGSAEAARQVKIGSDRWITIDGCKNSNACTIVLRANSFKALKMYEKAVNKCLRVVKSFISDQRVVAGGGSAEIALATRLKKWATSVSGQKSLAILRFAQVFETIPLQLSYNSGKDGIDLLSRLRSMHMDGSDVYGISSKGEIMNMFDLGVFEPLKVKKLLLSMLRETLIQLLRIDNVIIAKQIKGNVTTRDVAPIKDYNVKEIA
jgi:chaperonin GroEL (HSP60 family)